MNAGSSSNPFLVGSMITDPRYFVGRQAELDTLTSRMTGSRVISLNVVGKQRIGKSSLLHHFFQTYEQRVQHPSRYVVIYLNLRDSQCQREKGFYLAVTRQLLTHPSVTGKRELIRPWKNIKSLDRQSFSVAMGEWKRQGVLPVLCLDELEALFRHSKEFNDEFFNNLSSLRDSNILMLIVASHRRLNFYQRRYKLTSSFFNFEQILPLGELTEEEAEELVNLPAKTGSTAALNIEEQRLAREWGGCHPYLLQLAASCLWEARQQKQDISWAKARFKKQARSVPKPLLKIPSRLRKFAKRYGWIVIIILAFVVLISVLYATQILELLPDVSPQGSN